MSSGNSNRASRPVSGQFRDGQQEFTSKDIIPKGPYHKAFLLLATFAWAIILILTAVSLADATSKGVESDQYLAITVLVASLWYIYFSYHGIYKSNRYEIYAFLLALAIASVYIFYRLSRNQEDADASQYVSVVLIGLIDFCFIPVTFKLFRSFETWRFRKLIPALQSNPELRELYRNYEMWISLLKIDIQFGIVFLLMAIFFFLSTMETFLQMFGIFLTFGWAVLGHIGVRLEDSKLMFVFYLFSVLMPANIIWKLVTLSGRPSSENLPLPHIIFTGVVALLVRAALIIVSIRVHSKFGNNLRDMVFDPEEEEEPALSVIAEKEVKPYLTLTVKRIKTVARSFSSNSLYDPESGKVVPKKADQPPSYEESVPMQPLDTNKTELVTDNSTTPNVTDNTTHLTENNNNNEDQPPAYG